MSTNSTCQNWTHDFRDIGSLHSPVKPLPQIIMPTSSAESLKLMYVESQLKQERIKRSFHG